MIREAEPNDTARLDAFLLTHVASSMSLRGNLANHGTQERQKPEGTTFFIKEKGDEIEAVAAITNSGQLLCQAPDQPGPFWANVSKRIKGRAIVGLNGVPDQTEAWIPALKLEAKSFYINSIEPLFKVRIEDLRCDVKGSALRKPRGSDARFLGDWLAGFRHETGLPPVTSEQLAAGVQVCFGRSDVRVLVAQGQPVAMMALSAQLEDAVQVSNVYVPPAQRGKGYGGAIVALHLQELGLRGVKFGVLSAANEFAAKAYRSIGFQHIGSFRLVKFRSPMVVGGA